MRTNRTCRPGTGRTTCRKESNWRATKPKKWFPIEFRCSMAKSGLQPIFAVNTTVLMYLPKWQREAKTTGTETIADCGRGVVARSRLSDYLARLAWL